MNIDRHIGDLSNVITISRVPAAVLMHWSRMLWLYSLIQRPRGLEDLPVPVYDASTLGLLFCLVDHTMSIRLLYYRWTHACTALSDIPPKATGADSGNAPRSSWLMTLLGSRPIVTHSDGMEHHRWWNKSLVTYYTFFKKSRM